jgi:esterase/lipase superfamily enzyme
VPAWESYHLRELVPFVDGHFPTRADPAHRAVAGLSMGGGGAMKYAAAHPGTFGAAGSFSGAVDIDLPGYSQVEESTSQLSAAPGNGPQSTCKYGDPAVDEVIWRDNDPAYLASNLKGTALFVASGNGEPSDAVESVVGQMSEAFVGALDTAGIPHTADLYGAGTHTWPYWVRDLRHFLPWLRARFAHPAKPPERFEVRSARPAFTAWGWSFRVRRRVREFAYLRIAPHSVTATGSGTIAVRAPSGGRASIDLGPSHTTQQTDFGPGATAGWTTRKVRIR